MGVTSPQCGGHATGTGTVAYGQQATLDLAVVDVASGETTILDNGAHGTTSISPDRAWIHPLVAYAP